MTVRMPMLRNCSMRRRMPGLGTSDNAITPKMLPSTETASGVAPFFGHPLGRVLEIGRLRAAKGFGHMHGYGVDGSFSDHPSIGQIDAAHARLRREIEAPAAIEQSDRVTTPSFSAKTITERPSGVVSKADAQVGGLRQQRVRAGSRSGMNSVACRLPIVIVPVLSSSNVCTSPAASTAFAGHGEDIEPEGAIDAGDADGRQQRADGGGNERDQERDQVGNVDSRLQVRPPPAPSSSPR